MAVQSDTIVSRVEVEDATQQGANSAIQNLEKVATGAEKMSGAVQGTSNAFAAFDRAAGNSSRTLDRWRARADENERALQTLIRAENDYNRAIRTGQATVEEKTRVLDQLWKQTIGAADAANQNAIALERERQAADASQRAFNDLLGVNKAVTASAKASAAVFEEQARAEEDAARQAKQLEAANDALRSKYVPLHAVQQQYLAALRDIRTAGPEVFRSETERAAALQRTKDAFAAQVVAIRSATVAQTQAAAVVTSSARSYGGMGNIIQQSGYQIGDFAVQVASGQSAVRAFTQQGVQLVSMFGPWGAVVGAAGAVVGALATAFIDQDSAAHQNTQALDDYNRMVAQTKELSLEAAGAVRDLENAHKDAGIAALESGLAGAVAAQDQLQRQLRVQQDYVEALRAGADGGGLAASGDELRQAEKDLAELTDRFDSNAEAIDGMNNRLFILRDSLGGTTEAVQGTTIASEQHGSELDRSLERLERQIVANDNAILTWGMEAEAIARVNAEQSILAALREDDSDLTDVQRERIELLLDQYEESERRLRLLREEKKRNAEAEREAAKAAEESAREQEQAAQAIETAYRKAFDNIRDFSEEALGDSFYDILRGETTDFAEFLETTLLRAIANVAAAAATQSIVMPIATQVMGLSPGLFGLPAGAVPANQNSGGFNPLSAISNIMSGPTNVARGFVTSGIGQSLGLSAPIIPTGPTMIAPGIGAGATALTAGQEAAAIAGGWTGLGPTTSGQALMSAAGPVAAAVAAAFMAYQMGVIGPGPTSGPVGVADFSPGLGPDFQFGVNDRNPLEFLTADNGGNAEGMRPIAEAIADLIAESADRFAATIDQSLRFRVANYASPEAGNSGGRVQGFEVNAFIRGEAERRIAEGLDETQAIFEAFNFAVREAFTFESDTLREIARNTSAETTEDLLADLEFGRHFDMLGAEIDRLGGVVDQNTLAQAENTIAIQEQAAQTAEAAVQPILDALQRAIDLFPAVEGSAMADGAAALAGSAVDRLADGIAAIESDRGADRGLPGYSFTRGANDNRNTVGMLGTPSGDLTVSRIGSDEYGDNFAVTNAAGDVIETFRTMTEVLAAADDVAAAFAETMAEQQEIVGRTAEEQARYDANLGRVGFQIDVARQQVSTLVDTITGDFEGLSQGPFATALATGQAELDALRDHLEAVNDEIRDANEAFPELNAALIDVSATLTDAQAALLANLQSDFRDSIQAQINSAQGNGFLNTVQELLDNRSATADEAAALGLNVNDTAGALFSAQISNLLDGLTSEQIQLVRDTFDDAALVGAIDQVVASFGGLAGAAGLSAESMTAGVQAFTASLSAELSTLESATAEVSSSIRGLYRAINSNLVDRTLSPLSPLQRLQESERQLMEAFALANDNTPDDIESREARDRLADLVQTDNQLARDYYASSTAYSERFQRNQDLLRQTAVAQESLEQSMLSRLTEIRDLLAANDDGPNFGSTYSRLSNGQYVSDTGFDLGANPEMNLSILRALEAAGLSTPTGFGEGQLNALRASDSGVDALLRQALGFANGGAFVNGALVNTPTLFGMPGGLGKMAEAGPEAIMPLDRINGVLGVRAVLPSNDAGPGMSQAMVETMRADNTALRAEVALLREVVAEGANVNAEATRGVSRTIDRASRDARLRPRRGAAA